MEATHPGGDASYGDHDISRRLWKESHRRISFAMEPTEGGKCGPESRTNHDAQARGNHDPQTLLGEPIVFLNVGRLSTAGYRDDMHNVQAHSKQRPAGTRPPRVAQPNEGAGDKIRGPSKHWVASVTSVDEPEEHAKGESFPDRPVAPEGLR